MSTLDDVYVGEIRLCAHKTAPEHWAFCDGSLLDSRLYPLLFSLIGTKYGEGPAGSNKFSLPDLRGRAPLHRDSANGKPLAHQDGEEYVSLTLNCLPMHSHSLVATNSEAISVSAGLNKDRLLARSNLYNKNNATVKGDGPSLYAEDTGSKFLVALNSEACESVGKGNQHNNMQESLVLNYIIALDGLYPTKP